ncbi:hypothetical protein B0T09DRAFT_391134 [Sordaria sp. MPI-SDFR-AT-0083]|nr:hypothetical protein B0T09DRAFT_391134 [Sordaria sp. MPI-SDFR-AT-0083]
MATTTKATPTTTVQPLTRGPIHCHNEADYPNHDDVNPKDQDHFSEDFMDVDAKVDTIGPNDKPFVLRGFDNYGVLYVYRAEWVEGCVTTVSKQNFHYPLGESSEVTAYMLVRENYVFCNNGGTGGWTQAGCLKYTFYCGSWST